MSSKTARRVTVVLVCASLICALSLGVRHTFGLFMRPMTLDLQWGREAFSIAIALQNLVWGAARRFRAGSPTVSARAASSSAADWSMRLALS